MKKLLFLGIFLLTFVANAQNDDEKIITVQGHSKFVPKIEAYKAVIYLQLADRSYNNPTQFKTLEELKEFYFKNLQKQGIDTSKLVEDELSYYSTLGSYDTKGTILIFETSSEKEILKVAKERYGQMIMLRNINVRYAQDVNYDKAIKEALAEAKMKASKLAKELSVGLGDIKRVDMGESQSYYSYWTTYDTYLLNDYNYLTVTVEYFIK